MQRGLENTDSEGIWLGVDVTDVVSVTLDKINKSPIGRFIVQSENSNTDLTVEAATEAMKA